MYDRVYQSKFSPTVQKQNTEKAERKGMYLPSQSFDPFRNQEETMKSEDGKKGMYLPSQSFDPFRSENSPQANVAPAQMMEDEQIKKKKPQAKMDSAQMKEKKKKQIQKKTVQRNSANSFGADFSSKGTTTAMPRPVQQKMENSFSADFSNVAIHKDSDSVTNMGALAYAQGNEVHFAPGQYNPETRKGQELLGHELTHVVQQRQGRVQATAQGKGMAINDDPALEREADVMGAKAAEGKKAFGGSTSIEESKNITNSSAQMKLGKKKGKKVVSKAKDQKTNGLNIFKQDEFDQYKDYIDENSSKTDGYGYGIDDKHDCVTAVNRSMRVLLGDESIPAKPNMDDQMHAMQNMRYAGSGIEVELKDAQGNKTFGLTDPKDFLNDTLSTLVLDNSGSEAGYYFYGMSIMDGYHSVTIVVNKTDSTNVLYNIYDQHGSVLDESEDWYTGEKIDSWLKDYVEYGAPTASGAKGKTTTTITPIQHKE